MQLYPPDDQADEARDAVRDVFQNKTSGKAIDGSVSRSHNAGEDFGVVKTTI